MREYSIPALADIPTAANLADVVTRRAAEQPRAVALRRKAADGSWEDISCVQFRDEVHALAKGLIAAGISPGDRVAIMSHTRYEWTLVDYAAWTVGAVVVPIYETSSAEQTEWILSNSAARAVIVETDAFEDVITHARDRLPALEHLWRISPDLGKLVAGGTGVSDETLAERAGAAKAADLATVIYTSGTTGRPKGCELSHENLLADVRNAFMGPLAAIHETSEASTLLFLPLAHVFARIIEVGCLEAGIILGHCSDMNNLLPDLASFQPTFVLAVPRVFEKVYNGAEQRAAGEGRGKIFARAARTAVAYSEALDAPGRPRFALRAEHALFDRLVYSKLRAALGGKARWAVSGGAALAPRLGHFFRGAGSHRARGVRADRDDRRGVGEPPGPAEDRQRRPAAARSRRPHRRRRRGADPRQDGLPRRTGRTRRPPPRRSPRTAGSAAATSASSTTRGSSASPAGRRR